MVFLKEKETKTCFTEKLIRIPNGVWGEISSNSPAGEASPLNCPAGEAFAAPAASFFLRGQKEAKEP